MQEYSNDRSRDVFIQRTLQAILLLLFFMFSIVVYAQPSAYDDSAQRVLKNEKGEVHYIISFYKDAIEEYSTESPPEDGLPDWHRTEMRHFAKYFAEKYDIESYSINSYIDLNLIAFLSDAQKNLIINDPLVRMITPNKLISVEMPTVETANENLLYPDMASTVKSVTQDPEWNIRFMGGYVQADTERATRIYVLDLGIGYHNQLPSVITRVNPTGGKLISCTYAHAAHVAGIVAGTNTGIYRQAPIVSVTMIDGRSGQSGNYPINCGDYTIYIDRLGEALEYIVRMIRDDERVGIVNISMNGPSYNNDPQVKLWVTNLAQQSREGGVFYPGALVVQSAGNQHINSRNDANMSIYSNWYLPIYSGADVYFKEESCGYSFDDETNSPHKELAVLTVGGIDQNGQPVVALNGAPGFRNDESIASTEKASRFGRCVDIWAPSSMIFSTWGEKETSSAPHIYFDPNYPSDSTAYLSGTSMAAPHIAALAAYITDRDGLTTPLQIKNAILASKKLIGYVSYTDRTTVPKLPFESYRNTPIYTATLNSAQPGITIKPSIEFAFINPGSSNIISGQTEIDIDTFLINGNIKVNTNTSVKLSFDSIGASSCTINKYLNGANQGVVSSLTTVPVLVNGVLPSGRHEWKAACRGANGQYSYATALAEVQGPPQISWLIDGQNVSGTVYKTTSDQFIFAYTSVYADNCDLKAEKSTNGSSFTLWYNAYSIGANYNWGNQFQQLAAGWYRWTATCRGSGGITSKSLTMSVTVPAPTVCSDTMPMYTSRLSNSKHNTFMTTLYGAHQHALSIGYVNVGIIGKVEKIAFHSALKQFRRFYNINLQNHFMTYNSSDISYVLSSGWKDDGYAGYIYTYQVSGTIPLYQLYKTYVPGSDVEHRYVISTSERNSLQQQGWTYEKIAGYVCP